MNAIVRRLESGRLPEAVAEAVRGGRLGGVLITPRFPASQHVVALVTRRGARQPAVVVKIPRLPSDSASLEREARALRAVEALPWLRGTIPKLLALTNVDGSAWLVETALIGTPLDRRQIRQDPARALREVVGWLQGLEGDSSAESPEGKYERLVEPAIATLTAALGDADTARVTLTTRLLEPLRTAPLRDVIEHGDVSDPNILRLSDGRIGVVDWELSEPRGLPLHDLTFFAAAHAFALAGARSDETQARILSAAGPQRQGPIGELLEEHRLRLRIEVDVAKGLFVSCWTRYLAGFVERTGSPEGRFLPLWRAAVDGLS